MSQSTYQNLKDGIPTGETTSRSIIASCLTELEKLSLLNELADWGTLNGGGGNLVGPVTSVGLTTSIANGAITSAMVATSLSGKIVNGVNLSNSGPATQYLNKLGQYSTPVDLGTVTDVSIVTNDGVSGTVATATTTPTITLELGAITPQSVASAGAISGTTINGLILGRGTGTNTENVAIGVACLDSNTTGSNSVAVGYQSLTANLSGDYNTAIGSLAMRDNTSGTRTVSIGFGALTQNTTGDSNVAVGHTALTANLTGVENVAVGAYNSDSNTSGGYNTSVGCNAFIANTTGSYNTSLGTAALSEQVTGSSNTALGYQALAHSNGATENTAVGSQALIANITGSKNSALGEKALDGSLGSRNTGVGHACGYVCKTGDDNTFIGAFAGEGNLVQYNGSENTIVGSYGMWNATTSVSGNTMMGFRAGYSVTTSQQNILIGWKAANALTTGSKNIVIGYNIDLPAVNSANMLNIGNLIYGTTLDGSGTTLSTGRIGIGTDVPSSKFHVAQADTSTQCVFSGTTKAIRIGHTSTSSWIEGLDNTGFSSYQKLTIGGASLDFHISGAIKMSLAADGSLALTKTITAAATTGAQTINKPSGSVNFAAAATSLVVTNTLVTTSSVIICTIGTNDATMTSVQAVAAAGSFTIRANAAATAETRVNFLVIN